jgi:predicted ribosomally synthesized peptide with SipW-like signal peptide
MERGENLMCKKHTKSKLVTIAILLLLLSIAGTGTLAYFTDSTTAHNEITTGNINIAINQVSTKNLAVMPGMAVARPIVVTNDTASGEAWVRVQIKKQIVKADNSIGDDALIVMQYNNQNKCNDHWKYKDGYYYYNEALEKSETTAPLFDEIVFSPTMGNDYQNSTAAVTIYVQAVQTANNGKTVWEAAGWPN